jgi:hypothetical protein
MHVFAGQIPRTRVGLSQGFPPMHSKQYFSDANDLRVGAGSGLYLRHVMSLPGLGLPGLGLEEQSEQPHTTETTQHELFSGSEWRFEVAFGKFVKVRVSFAATPLYFDPTEWYDSYLMAQLRSSVLNSSKDQRIPSPAPRLQYLPTMVARLKPVTMRLKANTLPKRPP